MSRMSVNTDTLFVYSKSDNYNSLKEVVLYNKKDISYDYTFIFKKVFLEFGQSIYQFET